METIARNETPGDTRVNVEIPRMLWAECKSIAALEGRPLRYLLEDALRAYVAAAAKKRQ